MIKEFQNEYRFLSNFWFVKVKYEGIIYPTTEHAFQAAKSLNQEERRVIAELKSPSEAKKAGRKVTLRADWENVKEQVMYDLLVQKFEHPEMRQKLIETYPNYLQEGNHWGDKYWGVDVRTGEGKNRLGHLLMKVRGEIMKNLTT